MKKIIPLLALIASLSCEEGVNNYKITGNLEGYPDNTVIYLRDFHNKTLSPDLTRNEGFIDSTYLIGGEFKFTGSLAYPKRFAIHPKINAEIFPENSLTAFWLENSKIEYNGKKGDLFNATIKGSILQKEEIEYKKTISEHIDSLNILSTAIKNGDSITIEKYKENDIYKSQAYLNNKSKEFVKEKPSYMYSAILLEKTMYFISKEETSELYSKLTKEVQTSYYGKKILEYIKNQ